MWLALKRAFGLWNRDPVLIYHSLLTLYCINTNVTLSAAYVGTCQVEIKACNDLTLPSLQRCAVCHVKNSLVATLKPVAPFLLSVGPFPARASGSLPWYLSKASRVTLESSSWQCCEQTFKTQTLIASIMIQSAPAANVTVSKVPDPVPQCWVTC